MENDKVWYYWVFKEEGPEYADGRVLFFREPNEFLNYLKNLKEEAALCGEEAALCGAEELSVGDINRVNWYEPEGT
jgi:hypothetical protein